MDFAQGGSLALCSPRQMTCYRLREYHRLTPCPPGPLPVRVSRTQLEEEGSLRVLCSRHHITKLRALDARPIGFSNLHAIIPCKSELRHLLHTHGLHRF